MNRTSTTLILGVFVLAGLAGCGFGRDSALSGDYCDLVTSHEGAGGDSIDYTATVAELKKARKAELDYRRAVLEEAPDDVQDAWEIYVRDAEVRLQALKDPSYSTLDEQQQREREHPQLEKKLRAALEEIVAYNAEQCGT